MTSHSANLTEAQRQAIAYAPKPFAALSILSSLFVIYYLMIRHPEKRKRMYHRLILSTFLCIMPISFVWFWGTWAIPADEPWVVAASGTSVTCSIQGFLYIIFALAFPFYYASFSVFAYVAFKNNFQEEKYVWIEKWIHIGAYLFPLTLAIAAVAKDWIHADVGICTLVGPDDCVILDDTNCEYEGTMKIYGPIWTIIFIELAVSTLSIIYLLCTFDGVQKDIDAAIGMKRILEKARTQRLKEVAWQTGLYLASFWIGYIPPTIEMIVHLHTGELNYYLHILSSCVFALQGFIILVIYFALQEKSGRGRARIMPAPEMAEGISQLDHNMTVSRIRENAAKPRRASMRSSRSKFSFRIFDGTPAEDSPWLAYLEDASEESGVITTVFEEEENGENDMVASLLAGN